MAAPVSQADIEELYAGEVMVSEAVTWDERSHAVRAARQRRFGALVLTEEGLSTPDPTLIAAALIDGVRRTGLQRTCKVSGPRADRTIEA